MIRVCGSLAVQLEVVFEDRLDFCGLEALRFALTIEDVIDPATQLVPDGSIWARDENGLSSLVQHCCSVAQSRKPLQHGILGLALCQVEIAHHQHRFGTVTGIGRELDDLAHPQGSEFVADVPAVSRVEMGIEQ